MKAAVEGAYEARVASSAVQRLARVRGWVAWLVLIVPVVTVLVVDLSRRRERVLAFDGDYRWTYVAAIAESLTVWGLLLYAACRRRGSARWLSGTLFVVGLTLAIGGQRYFHDQYNAYLNIDVSLFASNFKDSVVNQLMADVETYAMAKFPFASRTIAAPSPPTALSCRPITSSAACWTDIPR